MYDLSTAKASSAAGCTAGVRYMFHFIMKDPVNAAVCKKANELQAKIVSGPGSGECTFTHMWAGLENGGRGCQGASCEPRKGGARGATASLYRGP